jgi:hypothetical protein
MLNYTLIIVQSQIESLKNFQIFPKSLSNKYLRMLKILERSDGHIVS